MSASSRVGELVVSEKLLSLSCCVSQLSVGELSQIRYFLFQNILMFQTVASLLNGSIILTLSVNHSLADYV